MILCGRVYVRMNVSPVYEPLPRKKSSMCFGDFGYNYLRERERERERD